MLSIRSPVVALRAARLAQLLLLGWPSGCIQPPSVTLGVRATLRNSQRHSLRKLEARVGCNWSLDRRSRSAAIAPAERAWEAARGALADDVSEPVPALEPDSCVLAAACAWEASERDHALSEAALAPDRPFEGEKP